MKSLAGSMSGKPNLAIPALAILAAAGWGWGIYQSATRSHEASPAGTADASGRPSARREARGSSIAALLPTARSAQLFASLDEIAGEPKGAVNKKLLTAMRTTLSDNDPTRRNRDFAILLDLMRPEDALAVHNLFLEFHRDGQTFGEYAPFANRWGQIDGAGALDALMNEQPMRLPPRDLRNIIAGWSRNDPQSALTWIKDHPEVPGASFSFDAVIQGWVNVDRDAATRYLLDHPLSMNDRVRATGNAADEILSSSGIEATVNWLVSFPPTGENNIAANSALNGISWRLGELPYDKAADAWATLSKNSIGGIDQLGRFTEASAEARTATQGTRGFIDALAEKWPVEQAVSSFATWSQQNPVEVKNYLTQYGDSPYIKSISQGLAAKGVDLSLVPQEEPDAAGPFEPSERSGK
ncbi:MAG: hypothetical protein JWO82_1867 [Akkermansiaceae bacterium]|nr:hypothetical protein [Akkermansiaceae bacterium]